MVDFNSVLKAAQELPEADQLRLIDALRAPFDEQEDEPLSDAWKAEIDRRVAEVRAGTAKLIPWETVRDEARRRIGLTNDR